MGDYPSQMLSFSPGFDPTFGHYYYNNNSSRLNNFVVFIIKIKEQTFGYKMILILFKFVQN
jgi:hypothetical protein